MSKQNAPHDSTKNVDTSGESKLIRYSKGVANIFIAGALVSFAHTNWKQEKIRQEMQIVYESYCSAMGYKGTEYNPGDFITPESDMLDLGVTPGVNNLFIYEKGDKLVLLPAYNPCISFTSKEVQKILNDCSDMNSPKISQNEASFDYEINGTLQRMNCTDA